jgi:hypothetical protein
MLIRLKLNIVDLENFDLSLKGVSINFQFRYARKVIRNRMGKK